MRLGSGLRVVIVEDHPIFREGLRQILTQSGAAEVIHLASSVEEALPVFLNSRPDVGVVIPVVPVESGVSLIRKAKKANCQTAFLVVTTFDGDEDIYQALSAGAAGYLPKDCATTELIHAVQSVSAGKRYLGSEIKNELAANFPRPDLTDREKDVLHFLSKGLKNREIGAQLQISELTVKVHIQNLLSKLDAQDRTHALRLALERGFVHLDDRYPRA